MACFHLSQRKGDDQAQTSPVPGAKPTHDIETKAMAEGFDTSLPSESEDSNPDESIKLLPSEKIGSDAKRTFTSSDTSDGSNRQNDDDTDDIETSSEVPLRNLCKRKTSKEGKSLLGEQLASAEIFIGSNKKRKKPSCSVVGLVNEVNSQDRHPNSASGSKSPDFEASSHGQNQEKVLDESVGHHTRKDVHAGSISNTIEEIAKGTGRVTTVKASSSRNPHGWSTMEKDLYLKGIEIFGENW